MTYFTYFKSIYKWKDEICSQEIENALEKVNVDINIYDEIDENILSLVILQIEEDLNF